MLSGSSGKLDLSYIYQFPKCAYKKTSEIPCNYSISCHILVNLYIRPERELYIFLQPTAVWVWVNHPHSLITIGLIDPANTKVPPMANLTLIKKSSSNTMNFYSHPSIDSNSTILNSVMNFLDKNAYYLGTYCILKYLVTCPKK